MMFHKLVLCLVTCLLLTACSDIEQPQLILNNNIEILRGQELSENELLKLIVDSISDDRDEIDQLHLAIANYDPLISEDVGKHAVTVVLRDQSGNQTNLTTKINVVDPIEQNTQKRQLLANELLKLKEQNVLNSEEYREYESYLMSTDIATFQQTLTTIKDVKLQNLNRLNKERLEVIKRKLNILEANEIDPSKYYYYIEQLATDKLQIDQALNTREQLSHLQNIIDILLSSDNLIQQSK